MDKKQEIVKKLKIQNTKTLIKNSFFINRLNWLVWLVPTVVVSFLLLFRLSDVAGLHRDEAALGLFAESIQNGLRPVCGYFNLYTAPIHSYIIAIFFSFFGKSIWSLRFSTVLPILFSLWIYADLIRRLLPNAALWAFWFLITMPAFIVQSRISFESFALSPLFLFGGIWSFYVLGLKKQIWISKTGYGISGLCFYLAIWNHIVSFPTVASVIIVYLIISKTKIIRMLKVLPWFFIGVLIGSIPKLYGVFVLGYDLIPAYGERTIPPFTKAFLNMVYTLGSDALYVRACGKILFSFNWFLPLCVLLSASIFIYSKVFIKQKRMWLAVALCAILSFLGTWLITPAYVMGSRVWSLPLWFIPLLLSLSLSMSHKWLRIALGTMIIVINITGMSINYFYNFLQDGGIPKETVYVGGRYDNSWDFIDIRTLVNRLNSYNNRSIYIEDANTARLQFLLPKSHRNRLQTIQNAIINKENIRPGSIIAIYKLKNRNILSYIKVGKATGIKRDELSTSHYEIFEVIEGT